MNRRSCDSTLILIAVSFGSESQMKATHFLYIYTRVPLCYLCTFKSMLVQSAKHRGCRHEKGFLSCDVTTNVLVMQRLVWYAGLGMTSYERAWKCEFLYTFVQVRSPQNAWIQSGAWRFPGMSILCNLPYNRQKHSSLSPVQRSWLPI